MYKEEQLKRLLAGKRILIAGYGREGKAMHELLQRLFPTETFDVAEGNEAIVAKVDAERYDMIIKSPGIPTFVFEGHCDLDIITSQTDIFLQVYGDQTIGITGTKGKSTTTTLIYSILSRCRDNVVLAGNMGIPLFQVLPEMTESTTVVAEFSCHQMENIHRAPHIAVLLNLYQEHLDHYHSYDDYKMAKMQIGLKQQPDDVFYYCADNAELAAKVAENKKRFVSTVESYSIDDDCEAKQMESRLVGEHNKSNVIVAYKVLQHCGVSSRQFAEALAEFKGLEHRLELVGTYRGITFYNDSISTIPAACEAAVGALGNVDTLIVGGFDRGIDYSGLAKFLVDSDISNIAIVGEAGRRILDEMKRVCHLLGKNIYEESDYTKIVRWCYENTQVGKVCLLSPAAASYDQFKNFEERGRVYKQLIENGQ